MTVLVDTSVWIEHLRHGQPALAKLLTDALVLTHPFVVGELACGHLQNRASILNNLSATDFAKPASHEEVLLLVETGRLWGRGLGWVDVHLLASALLSHCRFWTLDRKLARAALDLGLATV